MLLNLRLAVTLHVQRPSYKYFSWLIFPTIFCYAERNSSILSDVNKSVFVRLDWLSGEHTDTVKI